MIDFVIYIVWKLRAETIMSFEYCTFLIRFCGPRFRRTAIAFRCSMNVKNRGLTHCRCRILITFDDDHLCCDISNPVFEKRGGGVGSGG